MPNFRQSIIRVWQPRLQLKGSLPMVATIPGWPVQQRSGCAYWHTEGYCVCRHRRARRFLASKPPRVLVQAGRRGGAQSGRPEGVCCQRLAASETTFPTCSQQSCTRSMGGPGDTDGGCSTLTLSCWRSWRRFRGEPGVHACRHWMHRWRSFVPGPRDPLLQVQQPQNAGWDCRLRIGLRCLLYTRFVPTHSF
jgi:hypothetical protein